MSIKGRDKEFRTPKTTYVDFKHIEMDRVLTMLFPRLKYDGYASRRPPRGGDLKSSWRTSLSILNGLRALIAFRRWYTAGSKPI